MTCAKVLSGIEIVSFAGQTTPYGFDAQTNRAGNLADWYLSDKQTHYLHCDC